MGLGGLFVAAFLASTLLPGGSEAILVALSLQPDYSPAWLLAAASFGNTLGGMTSWVIGRGLAVRFPAVDHLPKQTQKAVQGLRGWGSAVLLLSWLPVIGDPLCVGAGWLRLPWIPALFWIGLGKTLRYGVILAAIA